MPKKMKESTTKRVQTKNSNDKNSLVKKKKSTVNKNMVAKKRTVKENKNQNKKKKKQVTVNKSIKTEKPIKKEKWYVWLKNNIIENEEKLSKKDRNRRLIISLFAIFCFFAVLISTFIIDFSSAHKKGEVPYFTIEKKDEYKQITVYYGLFYKAWRCDNGNTDLVYGRIGDKTNYCEIIPKYDENDIFTNPNKVKMTKSQVNIIKTYYFDDYIKFESKKELENAYKLSKDINKVLWVNGDQKEIINNDESVVLAIFGKEEIKDGVVNFSLQFDDPYYHKCVKQLNGEYLVSTYNYSDNTCGASWEKLTLSKETCKIAKESTEFIKKLAPVMDYCK